ncbi:MAG: endo-1,4-beta-xylanase [Acidimicrobiia bacterium]|nr:endo-1,4-beta-xylanase [Acidimicrobiia bacterium]MYG57535.1 endo-1,4-beta-xylanase [Acidimicrobiia bacterium]MYJ34295.1 endo-1,4-beta-xylanase [Acidimicrobiia bacterium]
MSLRDLAAAGGVRVGAAVNDQIFGSGDKHYRSLLADEFNSVTAERAMKWLWIHPEPDRWDWEASDELVEFADAHQMQVRGHTVVWPHWGTPDYITQCADADALRQHLVDHVRELFSHWEGSVARVDVVNEPLHWLEGRPADSAWRTLLGEDYLADVLTVAHEADSTIELWINETHTEVIPDKHDLFTRIVADLVERGLPLHGIGIQGHQLYPDFSPGPPDPDQLYRGVTTFADMGLEVAVTEMDVLAHPTDPDRLDVQGRIYGELVDAALSVDACREITFWGVSDAHSWVDEHFGADRAPLLFDREGHPKPAYDAVAAAFASRAHRTPVG